MCVYIYTYIYICVYINQTIYEVGQELRGCQKTICNMYSDVRRGFLWDSPWLPFSPSPFHQHFEVYHPQMGLVSMAKRLAGLSLAFLTESSVRWRCPHGFASSSSWNTSPCFRCSGHLGSIILAVRNKACHPRNHCRNRLILPVSIFNLERAPNKFLYRWYPMITNNSNRSIGIGWNWRIQPRRRPSVTRFGWIQI